MNDDTRNPVEILAEQFAAECRRGEKPSVDEYARRHPQFANELRDLLPTVAMMEQVKGRKPANSIPEQLGEYRIVREIGRGGMGIVYEAEQKALGRRVALKVAPAHLHLDPVRLERFKREAQAAARLHHTNIVPVFGVGEGQGLHYFVMQYIGGSGLNDIVAALKKDPGKSNVLQRYKNIVPLPDSNLNGYFQWVARIGIQVAEALSYAHGQGTLHRDIKPGNIILDAVGTAWVADFGLAKLSDQDDLTQSGDILGTLQYLAPETLKGAVDERSDVYSLALTIYELITLQPPFKNVSTLELLQQIGEREPMKPRQINPKIPQDLETIVLKGSAKNPSDRYPNARAFADDLRRFLDDRPIAARQAGTAELVVRWCRRNRALTVLGMTAVASLVLALVVGWVGYATASGALTRESQRRTEAEEAKRRAEANMKLSLSALEEVFAAIGSGNSFLPLPPVPGKDGPPPDGPMPGGEGPREGRDGPRQVTGSKEDKDNAAMLQSILRFYDKFASENQTNVDLRFDALRAQVRVGDLQMRSKQEIRAQEAFDRALKMAEQLTAEQKTQAEYSSLLAQSYFGLGTIRQRDNDADGAEKNYRKALALQEKVVALQPNDVEQRLFLNVVRHNLAFTLLDKGDSGGAAAIIDPAVAELEPLVKSKANPRAGPVLAMCFRLLSRMEREYGDPQKADDYRRRADMIDGGPRLRMPGPGPQGQRRPDDRDRDRDRMPPPPDWDGNNRPPPPDGNGPDDRRPPPSDRMQPPPRQNGDAPPPRERR